MQLIKAQEKDFERVCDLYTRIIGETAGMEQYARWKKGLYPTEEGIRAYMAEGALYLLSDGDSLAGAMAITMEQGEDYHEIAWERKVPDNNVAVVHIFGVSPDYQRRGTGRDMLRKAILLARENHKKAVRLDALASNTPARHLYESEGFRYRGKRRRYADNTGWTDFCFYEYSLE